MAMNDLKYSDYDNFAWFYNKYWSARLIDQIFTSIEKHLLDKLEDGSKILDLCCGNGHLSKRMSDRGFQVTGIDSSEEMLRYARINAPGCEFSRMDARNLHFDHKFDAVVSTCDSLNHIMSLNELESVFQNVYSVLSPGGYFLFDMNTEEGYKDYWNVTNHAHVENDNAFILSLSYDPDEKTSKFDITMFREIEKVWHRSDTLLTQRYYPVNEILKLLENTGFTNIEHYDTEKDLGIKDTGRVMYVMQTSK